MTWSEGYTPRQIAACEHALRAFKNYATEGYLTVAEYDEYREDADPTPPTYQTLRKTFDGWGELCEEAGIRADIQSHETSEWTREDVVVELELWFEDHDNGVEEFRSAGHGYVRPTVDHVYDHFDSWMDAVRAAGEEPLKVEPDVDSWAKEEVDRRIHQTIEDGEAMSWSEFREKDWTPSQPIIGKFYGGYNHALYELGYEPSRFTGFPDEAYIGFVQDAAEEVGRPPKSGEFDDLDMRLPHSDSVKRKLSCATWADVLEKAGLDASDAYRGSSYGGRGKVVFDEGEREDYLNALEELVEREGPGVNSTAYRDYLLNETELGREGWRRHWDTWADLSEEVEGAIHQARYDLSKAEVRDAYEGKYEELGRPPTQEEVTEGTAATRHWIEEHYGSHREALKAIGMDPSNVMGYSEEDCQEALNRVEATVDGHLMKTVYRREAREDEPSPDSLTRHYGDGSWNGVLDYFGLETPTESQTSPEACRRAIKVFVEEVDPPHLVSDYQEWSRETGWAPSQPVVQRRLEDDFSYLIGEAGGVPGRLNRDNYSEEDYQETIEYVIEETPGGGIPPAREAFEVTDVTPSVITLIREYGGWNDALEALGREVKFPSGRTVEGDYGDGGHYYGPDWYSLREDIRELDGECQICGVTEEEHKEENGCKLHIHHIVPFHNFKPDPDYDQANNPSNLVSLCIKHHRELEKLAQQEKIAAQVDRLGGGRWNELQLGELWRGVEAVVPKPESSTGPQAADD